MLVRRVAVTAEWQKTSAERTRMSEALFVAALNFVFIIKITGLDERSFSLSQNREEFENGSKLHQARLVA